MYRSQRFAFYIRTLTKLSTQRNCQHAIDVKKVEEQVTEKLSTLFVPGRHGSIMYQIVKPSVDYKYLSDHMADIKLSCRLRGIELGSEDILTLLKNLEREKNSHENLVKKDNELSNMISQLKTDSETANSNEDTYKALVQEQHNLLNNIKASKSTVYNLEDLIMPILQKIPNLIDKNTPVEKDVIESFGEIPHFNFPVLSHIEIASNKDLLEFSTVSPTAHFMTGKFAALEYSLQNFFWDCLNESDFAPMSCMDFVKSFLIEANGLDPYSMDDCIPIMGKDSKDHKQKLNLVGGASFESLCAYFTNMNFTETTLSLKYFSSGRRYDARFRNVESLDLFSVVQSTCIQCAILTNTEREESEFEALLDIFTSCYNKLNVPFRVVDVCAPNLKVTESRRKRIEVWSPSQKEYMPVAHVSQRNTFVSKRLQVTYGKESFVEGYCSIIEGSAVKIPVLLGCIVENCQTSDKDFKVPDVLS